MSAPEKSGPVLRERLPRISKEALAVLQQAHARHRRWQIGSGENAFWFEIVAAEACMATRVAIVINGIGAELQLHSNTLEDIGELDWSDYQGSARLTAWTLAHRPALKQLTQLFGSIVLPQAMLDDNAPVAVDLITVGFRMGQADQTIDDGVLRAPLSAVLHLLKRDDSPIPDALRAEHWNQLPALLRISLRGPTLPQSAWRSLETGDVIVLGQRDRALAEMNVTNDASSQSWLARWGDEGVRIEALAAVPIDDTGYPPMNEENDQENPSDAPMEEIGADPLAQLPVKVEFVLGEVSLPLGELTQLQPGYVFALQTDIDNARVTIRASSRNVGYGRLVAVGDTLAVQLESWSKDGFQ